MTRAIGDGTPADGPTGPSDETLALRTRQGNLAAFGELARRYQSRVYTYALRMIGDAHEAADLTQEAMLRAFQSLERFDTAQRFGAWLFGIAAHVCRDWLRRRSRRPVRVSDLVVQAVAAVMVKDEAVGGEERERLLGAVRALPLKYREVIVLHYLEEMGYEEVARALGIAPAAARRRALRAREMLRRRLGDQEEG